MITIVSLVIYSPIVITPQTYLLYQTISSYDKEQGAKL